MQDYFYRLVDKAQATLAGPEVLTAYVSGEDTDFCRLNHARLRQCGSVKQAKLQLRLIHGQRHAQADMALSGTSSADEPQLVQLVHLLREQLRELPEDPHLLYCKEVASSERRAQNELPDSAEVISRITTAAAHLDLVGIYAAGRIYRGFANSLGQRNWFETTSFNFDFSLYLTADKAVKSGYAGWQWDEAVFKEKLAAAEAQAELLRQPPITLAPGKYRVYLAPQALAEVVEMLSWGGFSLKAQNTKQTPLLKMLAGQTMAPGVTLIEDTAGGGGADFNDLGFRKPEAVSLIAAGRYDQALVSPRSAKEYGVETNGASSAETPEALALAAGDIAPEAVLSTLGDGIYLNNLWYLNFSDRPAARITGMTRFAAFKVEAGVMKQPLNVMRFDDSVLRMFGDHLVGLTTTRELLASARTYGQRWTETMLLPGAVIDGFNLTL